MILGIDATNWIHCYWHAHNGQGVLAAVARRIDALVETLKPSHVVACLDRPSFRGEIFPAYKTARKQKDPGLLRDLDEAADVLCGHAVVCQQDECEADDCLATLAMAGAVLAHRVVLASPDKDLRQCLVQGQTTILRTFETSHGAMGKADWFNADRLQAEYGLAPAQWIDFQTLCGDSGDGIPGCKGWGEKTTLAALQKAGSLEAILANPWALALRPKQQAALLAFKSEVVLMRTLVTLRTDVAAAWDAIR